jgi:hypothetical protein
MAAGRFNAWISSELRLSNKTIETARHATAM